MMRTSIAIGVVSATRRISVRRGRAGASAEGPDRGLRSLDEEAPPFARSKTPLRVLTAPVNAPRSWPNSSDSSRFGGTAVQSNTTYGARARGPCVWRDSASTSLPVPVSPSMMTGTVAGSEPLAERIQSPHFRRSRQRRLRRTRRRTTRGCFRRDPLDHEARLAQTGSRPAPQQVTPRQRRGHLDERPVGRFQIGDLEAMTGELEPGMST